jgi:ABC-type uncharacterized transport system permease subunit
MIKNPKYRRHLKDKQVNKNIPFLIKLEHTMFEFNIILLVIITLGVALLFYKRQPKHPHSNSFIHWIFQIIVQEDDVDDYI